jgi:hypothetical protein
LLRLAVIGFAVGLATTCLPGAVRAEEVTPALAERLTAEQLQVYEQYHKARSTFDRQLQAYWRAVDSKREARKARRMLGQAYTADDYITEQPPKYRGPELPSEIARIVTEVRPPEPERPMPNVADFLGSAKAEFGFVPTPTTEHEFKRRYAKEALAVGLSKDQVLRIYALETGGQGTYDMQSGINPLTKQGKPISSALGYAQLLHANSTSEFVKYGEMWAKRLLAMAAVPGTPPERATALRTKAATLRRMLRAARSVPNEWSSHVAFGGTAKGQAIHTLNLDADVGPWLQVLKLRGLKDDAERAGRPNLTGGEIELMNLAGPRTGLEMLTPVAQNMPTSNFFSQGGYYRNTVVREKTAIELLRALEGRMEANIKKPGAVEFAQIFDEAARK